MALRDTIGGTKGRPDKASAPAGARLRRAFAGTVSRPKTKPTPAPDRLKGYFAGPPKTSKRPTAAPDRLKSYFGDKGPQPKGVRAVAKAGASVAKATRAPGKPLGPPAKYAVKKSAAVKGNTTSKSTYRTPVARPQRSSAASDPAPAPTPTKKGATPKRDQAQPMRGLDKVTRRAMARYKARHKGASDTTARRQALKMVDNKHKGYISTAGFKGKGLKAKLNLGGPDTPPKGKKVKKPFDPQNDPRRPTTKVPSPNDPRTPTSGPNTYQTH